MTGTLKLINILTLENNNDLIFKVIRNINMNTKHYELCEYEKKISYISSFLYGIME